MRFTKFFIDVSQVNPTLCDGGCRVLKTIFLYILLAELTNNLFLVIVIFSILGVALKSQKAMLAAWAKC